MSPVDYDPFSSEVMADPFPAYERLRTGCPVHRFEGFDPPFFTMTRYADVHTMLRDWELWSSHWGQSPRFTRQGGLFNDPPEHTYYRKLIQSAFSARRIAAMHDDIVRLCHDLVDVMTADGRTSGDLHDDLACPLPVIVIADMLGVPPADLPQFKHWSDVQVEAMGSSDPHLAVENRRQMDAYFQAKIDERRALQRRGEALPDDLVTALMTTTGDHPTDGHRGLTDTEMLGQLNQLLVGGNETTTSLLTNLVWRLLEDPARWERLRTDRSLLDTAIEESLRFDPPVLGLFRTNTRELDLDGVTVPTDSKAFATYAAANRDPEVFADPDTFDLDRDPAQLKRHLAFGFGQHFCPGAPLSRLEARIVMPILLDRLPRLRLDGPTTRIATFLLWGRRTMPVRWD
jgi:cytochrome P450